MHWLTPADEAMKELAFKYADLIDEAIATGDPDLINKRAYLGPHLVNALKALGGAPADRKALGIEAEVKGKLALLREKREKKSA